MDVTSWFEACFLFAGNFFLGKSFEACSMFAGQSSKRIWICGVQGKSGC